jgi:hypothetical protein
MLAPLKIPPGVYRNGTNYQAAGRYWDANLVRWYEGTMRPIGGWQRATTDTLSGSARGMFSWRDNDYDKWLAIGTHSKLYVWNGGNFYDITPSSYTVGRSSSFAGYGYGAGSYGASTWGTKRSVGAELDATTWSLDNWGENLVACANSDGKLYEWALNTGSDAAAITNAPTDNTALIVTPERYLFALGAGGNPRLVQWSDQEDNTVWTPSGTNTAGSLELQTNGRILAAKRVRGQILILTETDAHVMNYLGPPLVYGQEKVGSFCGMVGPQACAVIEGGAVWMSAKSFFLFNGQIQPLPCSVGDYVFTDINLDQTAKVYAGQNSAFGEVWWFYPSASSDEVDRYVIWNYRENHWSIGGLTRTCWTDAGVFQYPLAVGTDGYLYEHESGWTDNGSPLTSTRYAESGPVEFGVGDRFMAVRQILPDEKSQGQVKLTFYTKPTPESSSTTYGPYTMQPYTNARFTGRQVAMRVVGNADADWRVGTIRLDAVPGSGR